MNRRCFIAAAIAALIQGCGSGESKTQFNATDITGIDWARGFDLPDHTGKRRTLDDFKGKVVLVFFGFTHCPDACPTALAEMAEVIRQVDADGERVQGLFITVDPERDTREVLAKYVSAFHPSLIALRGTPDEVAKTAKEFKVHYQLNRKPDDGGHYTVDHTSAIFVFDPKGRVRLYVSENGRTVEKLVQDVRQLLDS